ncbi:MAG: preprotein translocase subunit YajC [Pirellulales bacterium]
MDWAYSLDILINRCLLLAQAAPDEDTSAGTATEAATGNSFTNFLMNPMNFLLLLLLVFYFIVLLPQQRQMKTQQKALADALSSLKKNDRVVTSGGIHGTVVQTSPETGTVTIRIDEGTGAKMTLSREAIARVVDPDAKQAAKQQS